MLQWAIDKVKWLLGKAQEIIDWTYQLFLDVLARIRNAIEIVKNYALYTAITYYNLAVNQINAILLYLYQFVLDVRCQIINTLQPIIDNVTRAFYNFVAAIGTYIAPYIEALRAWVSASLAPIIGWVQQMIAPILGVINWVKDRIGELSNLLQSIHILSFNDIVKIVTDQIQPTLETIRDFINDPVGYILAIVVDNFMPILSAIIAYGMGTVKYDLPPAPVFYQKNKRK